MRASQDCTLDSCSGDKKFTQTAPIQATMHLVAPSWCDARAATSRKIMDMNAFFADLQNKINQAIENSPAKDIEKNVKAMMTQGFAKLDLVTREEFDVQAQVLAKTRSKLEALEARAAELEARLNAGK
jgi:BMFP domain-containing protein YqiC